MQKQSKKVIQNEVPKRDLFDIFKGLVPGTPQDAKSEPKGVKMEPQAIKKRQKNNKQVREMILKAIRLGGKT